MLASTLGRVCAGQTWGISKWVVRENVSSDLSQFKEDFTSFFLGSLQNSKQVQYKYSNYSNIPGINKAVCQGLLRAIKLC